MHLPKKITPSREKSNHENGFIHRCSGITLMGVSVRYLAVGSRERAKVGNEVCSSRTYRLWPTCKLMCRRTLNRQDAKGIKRICAWLASLRLLITKGYHCLMNSRESVIWLLNNWEAGMYCLHREILLRCEDFKKHINTWKAGLTHWTGLKGSIIKSTCKSCSSLCRPSCNQWSPILTIDIKAPCYRMVILNMQVIISR